MLIAAQGTKQKSPHSTNIEALKQVVNAQEAKKGQQAKGYGDNLGGYIVEKLV